MTQNERATEIAAELVGLAPQLERLERKLDDLLAESQNAAEYGGASDGTIDPARWDRMRLAQCALLALCVALNGGAYR